MDILTFEVDRRTYGVAVSEAREILRAVDVTPLPAAPVVVGGVINLRGSVVPVVDLRIRFGAPPRPLQLDEHFIVVQAQQRLVALRTDRVVEVQTLGNASIQPATGVAPAVDFVAGLVTLPDGLLVIADASAFLTEAESARLNEALADRAAIERAVTAR